MTELLRRKLKAEAERRGCSMSEVVTDFIKSLPEPDVEDCPEMSGKSLRS